MVKAAARREPVRLSYRDGEVVVTIKDQDRFVISAQRATEARREAVRLDERIARFSNEFLLPLRDWCVAHADRVSACYIPLPAGHIQVFVLTTSARFDFALAAEVAELERKLAASGWRVGLAQLPATEEETLATFFDPEGALEVYAQRRPASPQGGG